MKIVRAEAIVQELEFDTVEEMDMYLYKLDHQKKQYEVLQKFERPDRSVVIRIIRPRGETRLIRLYNG